MIWYILPGMVVVSRETGSYQGMKEYLIDKYTTTGKYCGALKVVIQVVVGTKGGSFVVGNSFPWSSFSFPPSSLGHAICYCCG